MEDGTFTELRFEKTVQVPACALVKGADGQLTPLARKWWSEQVQSIDSFLVSLVGDDTGSITIIDRSLDTYLEDTRMLIEMLKFYMSLEPKRDHTVPCAALSSMVDIIKARLGGQTNRNQCTLAFSVDKICEKYFPNVSQESCMHWQNEGGLIMETMATMKANWISAEQGFREEWLETIRTRHATIKAAHANGAPNTSFADVPLSHDDSSAVWDAYNTLKTTTRMEKGLKIWSVVARPKGDRGKYSAFSLAALARMVVICEFGDEWKKKFMRITPNTLDKNLTPEQSAKRVQDAKNKCRDILRKGGAVSEELQRIAARVMICPFKKKKRIINNKGHSAKAGLCKECLWLWVL